MKRRFLVTIDADEKTGKGALRNLIGAKLAVLREVQAVRVAYAPDPVKAKKKPAKKRKRVPTTDIYTRFGSRGFS